MISAKFSSSINALINPIIADAISMNSMLI